MTTTHTRTHVTLTFANPYLVCRTCRVRVPAWHQPAACGPGCDRPARNIPCGHLGALSLCPTWTSRGGCRCEAEFGHVPHSDTTQEAA